MENQFEKHYVMDMKKDGQYIRHESLWKDYFQCISDGKNLINGGVCSSFRVIEIYQRVVVEYSKKQI